MPTVSSRSNVVLDARAFRLVDLGFSNWETSWNRPSLSTEYFEVFLARPRGAKTPFNFLLKALRPEFCGSRIGGLLVERERAIGSINCRRLLQVVDWDYPRRVSTTKATRGYLVFPYCESRSLKRMASRPAYKTQAFFDALKKSLDEIADALDRNGWTLRDLATSQILVSKETDERTGAPVNFSLFDYGTAQRATAPSLLAETLGDERYFNVSFDLEFDPRSARSASESAREATNRLLARVAANGVE